MAVIEPLLLRGTRRPRRRALPSVRSLVQKNSRRAECFGNARGRAEWRAACVIFANTAWRADREAANDWRRALRDLEEVDPPTAAPNRGARLGSAHPALFHWTLAACVLCFDRQREHRRQLRWAWHFRFGYGRDHAAGPSGCCGVSSVGAGRASRASIYAPSTLLRYLRGEG